MSVIRSRPQQGGVSLLLSLCWHNMKGFPIKKFWNLGSWSQKPTLAISWLALFFVSKVSTSMSAAGFPQQEGKRYSVLESLANWRMSPKRWNDSNPSRSFRETLSLEQSILWLSLTCFRCEGLFSRPSHHIDRVWPGLIVHLFLGWMKPMAPSTPEDSEGNALKMDVAFSMYKDFEWKETVGRKPMEALDEWYALWLFLALFLSRVAWVPIRLKWKRPWLHPQWWIFIPKCHACC